MITPIQGNILIEPVKEETAWASSQEKYEERGKVLAIAEDLTISATPLIKIGDFVYFDSWQAARFKDANQNDVWLVHIDAIRAIEHEPSLSE